MTDSLWPQIFGYFCLSIFLLFTILLYLKYARMPIHLRWELYPVPHEASRPYGGSYFEETDWWTKPREKSTISELKFMGREIFSFREYWQHNRGYWYFVYPFHLALYLLLGWIFVLLVGALTIIGEMPISGDSSHLWSNIVYYASLVIGIAAFTVGTTATAALLLKRSTDENLKPYTAPLDYIHLIVLLVIFGSGLCAWAIFDRSFTDAQLFMHSLITADQTEEMNPALGTFIITAFLFLLYMPFTSMMHYLAKHFTFTRVLWEDEPNLRGTPLEKQLESLLDHSVTWSAPHIQYENKWCQIAREMPQEHKKADE